MTLAINAHKKMAMGITEGNVMKKGGKVKKYANGGAVSESKVANLPAKGSPLKPNMTTGREKIATMKKGGSAQPKLVIAIGIGKKAGRGR